MSENVSEIIKNVSSISYISGKLGISRPTLYKYLGAYQENPASVPEDAREFFDFCANCNPSSEDIVLFFSGRPKKAEWGKRTGAAACLTEKGRAMIVLRDRDAGASVEVAAVISGETIVLGEFYPEEGRGYVTLDLIPSYPFRYRVSDADGNKTMWEEFTVDRCRDIFCTKSRGRPPKTT